MNSNVLDKIKKLLSLANSDNANERDLALAKAQSIAIENDIDLALLDTSDVGLVKEEPMVEDEVEIGSRIEVQKKFAAHVVKEVCMVEVIYNWRYTDGKKKNTVNFLGKKVNVDFAKWLYSFLLDEYMRRWNYERKTNHLPLSHRNTFFLGVKDGQWQKIREEGNATRNASLARHATAAVGADAAPEAVKAKQAELGQKYSLALVDEKNKRKSFLNQKYPRFSTMRSTRVSVRSHDTYSSGTAHGRSIGLNRPLN